MSSLKNEIKIEYKNPDLLYFALDKLGERPKWNRRDAVITILRYRLTKEKAENLLKLLESCGYIKVSQRRVIIKSNMKVIQNG